MKNLFKINFLKPKLTQFSVIKFLNFSKYNFSRFGRTPNSDDKSKNQDSLSNSEFLNLINEMKVDRDMMRDPKLREVLKNELVNHISDLNGATLDDVTEILANSEKLPGNDLIEMINRRKSELQRSNVRSKTNSTSRVQMNEEQDEEQDEEQEGEKEEVPTKQSRRGDGGQSSEEACEVFVANLPWRTDEQEVADLFSSFGNVEGMRIVTDRETGRSKGFGFVRFDNPESARRAAQEGNDNLALQGRNLIVRISETKRSERSPRFEERGERSERSPRFEERGERSTTDRKSEISVFVGGLSYKSSEDEIKSFFQDCGNVTRVKVPLNPEGRPRGIAFVHFDSEEAISRAVNKSNMELDGRQIRVEPSTPGKGISNSREGFDRPSQPRGSSGYSGGSERSRSNDYRGRSENGGSGYSRDRSSSRSRGGESD